MDGKYTDSGIDEMVVGLFFPFPELPRVSGSVVYGNGLKTGKQHLTH